jgi:hypothetical protein
MNALARDVVTHIGATENEAIARFYDKVGLGNLYRYAVTPKALKGVIARFTAKGYETLRIPMKSTSDSVVCYQMLLMYNGVEIAHQDLQIETRIGEIVEHAPVEVSTR